MRSTGDSDYINATVPGTVYCDLLAAGKMEDPFWKDNEDKALALMDSDYEYVTEFDCAQDLLKQTEVLLVFEGLDTLADIYLNGKKIAHTESMHRTWKFAVKNDLNEGKNELKVVFSSPTKYIAEAYSKAPTRGTEDAMNGFVHIRKAHYMFGWDWGAHLPDAGIWRPVYLLGIDRAGIESVSVLQYHEDGKVRIELDPEIDIYENLSFATEYKITDPDGEVVKSGNADDEIIIDNPKLIRVSFINII